MDSSVYPLIVLAIGIATVLGLIIALRVNAFLALIVAALIVSLLSAGDPGARVERVAGAFGSATAGIGIVIALASIIGKCMLDSGAADRVVRAFTHTLGEKRAPLALMSSGFVLAIPVFFDTVFYLLVPLARSLYRRTGKNYLRYLIAIGAGGAITHTLVPPTPGPLLIAANLGVDPGMMIMMGLVVAIVPATVGLIFGAWIDRTMPIPMRALASDSQQAPLKDEELPALWISLLPVVLPVVLISANTALTVYADSEPTTVIQIEDVSDWDALRAKINAEAAAMKPSPGQRIYSEVPKEAHALISSTTPMTEADKEHLRDHLNALLRQRDFYSEAHFKDIAMIGAGKELIKRNISRMQIGDLMRTNRVLLESAYPDLIKEHNWDTPVRQAANWSALLGNANLALLLSAAIAIATLGIVRNLSLVQLAHAVEQSLMDGGLIILITAAGGAFGAMLTEAKVGDAIREIASQFGGSGITLLLLGFTVAAVFKIAQGSTTVSMITTSGMLAGIATVDVLGFHPVYLATSIGCGALAGSWMNDSGFWVFAKMGGLTEGEALKSWTILLALMAFTGLGVTVALAMALPLTYAAS